jgi:hypothetical protein
MGSRAGEITQLLQAMQTGHSSAADRVLPLMFKELHELAANGSHLDAPSDGKISFSKIMSRSHDVLGTPAHLFSLGFEDRKSRV